MLNVCRTLTRSARSLDDASTSRVVLDTRLRESARENLRGGVRDRGDLVADIAPQ